MGVLPVDARAICRMPPPGVDDHARETPSGWQTVRSTPTAGAASGWLATVRAPYHGLPDAADDAGGLVRGDLGELVL